MKRKRCFAFIEFNSIKHCGALIDLDCTHCAFYKLKCKVDDKTMQLINKEKKRIEKKEAKNEHSKFNR